MFSFLLPIYIVTSTPPPPPPTYTWCVFQMVQVNTKEMITAAYGMGNVPTGTDLNGLCRAFYTRDIRAEDKPLELISFTGTQNQTNPDLFWLANTTRRNLTAEELELYDCILNKGTTAIFSQAILDLMPQSPDSIRVPALMITAIDQIDSPIMRYAAVVLYNTGMPIMIIGGLVKAWKLAVKR
jgi:hypothetical protein